MTHEALHNLGLDDDHVKGALGLDKNDCGIATDCITGKLAKDCFSPERGEADGEWGETMKSRRMLARLATGLAARYLVVLIGGNCFGSHLQAQDRAGARRGVVRATDGRRESRDGRDVSLCGGFRETRKRLVCLDV